MSFQDLLRDTLATLWAHKRRTMLTMFGIAWGIISITVMVAAQALINFGVVLGMMPTKGIPLPFISYGGSSLLVMLLATGVLLNISRQATEPAWQ